MTEQLASVQGVRSLERCALKGRFKGSDPLKPFGLIGTILGCLKSRAEAIPYAVGLYITAAYWFTSSTSFANPAVTIARGFSNTFAGIQPVDIAAFVGVQLLAACLAAFFFKWLLQE